MIGLVGLALLWTLTHFAQQSQNPIPWPITRLPQTVVEEGIVVADDEAPASAPYQRDGRASSRVPDQPTPNAVAKLPSARIIAQQATPKSVGTDKYVTINNKEYPLRTYEPLLVPNDPMASQTWVTKANFNQTWDIPHGNHQTVLAIIDTGFGLLHEEFANRWHINSGESGPATAEGPSQLNCAGRGLPLDATCNLVDEDSDGVVDNETGFVSSQNPSRLNCSSQSLPLTKDCNRLDDDNNGYVDDKTGWDFANNDNSPQAGELNPTGSGTTHGTRVAGVAAATGNNGKGIAGANWQTKILPIQALDDDSYGDTLGVGRAILYAAQQGADVISLSLGSDLPDDYVREAIQIAIAAGSVVVAASGNDGCDCIVYPANYPEVVAVGALESDSNGNSRPAGFSSFGTNLDILAPGTQVTTSSWTSSNPSNAYVSNIQGTSFATPLVSGLLTRILSHQPDAAPLQLIAALTENTNRLTLSATTARSPQLGYGTMDAFKSTARMTTARRPAILYGFDPVSIGNQLVPQRPAETAGQYVAQHCEPSAIGTTPLYELTKPASLPAHFFSISPVEIWTAQQSGYQSKIMAEVCLKQPHDRPETIRNLNLFKEFRNIYKAL